jgi:hypothetical protein
MQSNRKNDMKTNIMKKSVIIGAAGLALSGLSARANSFSYSNGDLLVDFSQSGASDVEVDLGSLSALQAQATAAGGTVDLTGAANGYTLAQLNSAFAGNYDGVSFTAFGTLTGSNPATDYLSQKRLDPGTQTTAPADFGKSKNNTVSSLVLGLVGYPSGTGILNYSGATTANVAVIPTAGISAANSFTTKSVATGGLIPSTSSSIKNTTATGFTSGDGSIVSDLYQYNGAGVASQAVFEGDFTFNGNGTLDFSYPTAAAPEPGAYGVLAATGLLLVAVRRQIRLQQA